MQLYLTDITFSSYQIVLLSDLSHGKAQCLCLSLPVQLTLPTAQPSPVPTRVVTVA